MTTQLARPANGQLTPYKKKVDDVRDLLTKSRTQIGMALPKHMNADRLVRITMTSVQRTPKLLDCSPESLAGAVIQSAQLGLEPDNVLGHAYLVPFFNSKKRCNEVQFIAGYRGLIDLARRTGQVSTIYAHVVRKDDHFDYEFGLNPDIKHKPSGNLDGEVTHAYAVCRLKDGSVQFDVMTRAEVDRIRTRSKSATSGPWVTDFDEMAKKTVLRRLCKMLPSSVELARAVALDERADIGISQDLDAIIEPPDDDQPESNLGALTSELSAEDADQGESDNPDLEIELTQLAEAGDCPADEIGAYVIAAMGRENGADWLKTKPWKASSKKQKEIT